MDKELLAIILVMIAEVALLIYSSWKAEKKGYSFWGIVFFGSALINLLGHVSAMFMAYAVALLLPDRKE